MTAGKWLVSVIGAMVLQIGGCATEVPPLAQPGTITDGVVVGRVLVELAGATTRWYEPELRFFEVEEVQSNDRFTVHIESKDQYFVIDLPPGEYRLNRVQVSEGPFLSMADLAVTFSVAKDAVTYVGTWRFEVGSPRYGRTVEVSMVVDQQETAQTLLFLHERYPALVERFQQETVPQPSRMEARLYEVMPYPRVARYFRRHWW